MKTLEEGSDKIKHICEVIKKDTLKPAQDEAKEIVAEARKEAEAILKEAEKNAEQIVEAARECNVKEKTVFLSSLQQACKQTMEALRQSVEQDLFNEELAALIEKESADPRVIANLITTIVAAIEKDGIGSNLSAEVARSVSSKEVSALLADGILSRLQGEGVNVGNFRGGATVRVLDKKFSIDISDEALKELLSSYVRKDFRKFIFKN